MRRSAVAVMFGALALVAGCSSDSGSSGPGTQQFATAISGANSTATGSAPTTAANSDTPSIDLGKYGTLPAIPVGGASTVNCSYPSDGTASKANTAPSASNVPATGTAAVAITTSQGPIGLTLNRAAAPCTVNSFVSLARQGYYNDTPCHRLTTSSGLKVLQCGDPSGSGSGGPGYGYDNEYPSTAVSGSDAESPVVYPRGTLAMANTGQPGSNGSQFFLVYADSVLPPQYTVFGSISTVGLSTLDTVAAAGINGSGDDGAPAKAVQFQTVTVS